MKRAKAHSRRRRGWRIFGVVLLILLAFVGVKGYQVVRSLTKGGSMGDIVTVFQDPRKMFPGRDRIIVLIAGKDYNHDSKDQAYTTGSRSDTIMLLSMDLANNKLSAVSIPRDTHVTAPDGVTGKINGTFQRGGINLLSETIDQQFGIKPDYYVVLKADAVKEIVNAVGGVDVNAIDDMFYEDYWGDLKINITKGEHHLNGQEAVGFVRFRKTGSHRFGPKGEKINEYHHPSLEEGDIRRGERQQQLIHALVMQGLQPGNLMKIDHLVDVAFSQVETNLKQPQLLALANLYKQSQGGEVAGASLPGKDAMIDGTYFWDPDIDKAKLTMNWILKGDDTAGRELTNVVVYHTSPRADNARNIAKQIEGQGFNVQMGGHPKGDKQPTQSEVLFRKAAYASFAKSIADSLGIKTVSKDTSSPAAYWLPEVKVVLVDDNVTTPTTSTTTH